MADIPFPILLPSYCFSNDATLDSAAWQFSQYLSELERSGIGWHEFPDEIRYVGSLNTACGGLKSNGTRTSLRNLVVLSGLEYTREFLQAAKEGAKSLNWWQFEKVVLAELEWLDLVGSKAAGLLDNYDHKLHLLDAIDSDFSRSLQLTKYGREEILGPCRHDICERFLSAEANGKIPATNHNARIFLYLLNHPGLDIVPHEEGSDAFQETWQKRVTKCVSRIKGDSSLTKTWNRRLSPGYRKIN